MNEKKAKNAGIKKKNYLCGDL